MIFAFLIKKKTIQLCSCKFNICKQCIDKLDNFICPVCKTKLRRKIFFSGKIIDYWDGDEQCSSPDINQRIIVCEQNMLSQLTYHKCGDLEINEDLILDKNIFLDLEQTIPYVLTKKYIISGPCVCVNPMGCSHGSWNSSNYEDMTKHVDILNKRNDEMIERCQVFSLKVSRTSFRSFAEWGKANQLNKILLITFEGNLSDDEKSEYYLFCQDSINSLKKIPEYERNLILYIHPDIDSTPKEYIDYLTNIIKNKKQNNCSIYDEYNILKRKLNDINSIINMN